MANTTSQGLPSHHGAKVSHGVKKEYPNETMKLLLQRASCRRFDERPIDRELLDTILEAGIHAPSGGNLQPMSIIVIEDEENRSKMGEICGQSFVAQAPVNLVYCIDWHRLRRWAELEKAPFSAHQAFYHFWISIQDVIISAQNTCTAADAMDLGTCYVGTILEHLVELREILKTPPGVLPVVLLCVGYPQLRPFPRKKLPQELLVHREIYRDPEPEELLNAMKEKFPENIEITPERMETFHRVSSRIAGEENACKWKQAVEEQGSFNPAQRYFGLHYEADGMIDLNGKILESIIKSGFEWIGSCDDPAGGGDK